MTALNATITTLLKDLNIDDQSINDIITCNDILDIMTIYNIHQSWKTLFDTVNIQLSKVLKTLDIIKAKQIFYPHSNIIFKVFEMDINDISIVFLGQDPYINPNQATGLSFSVPQTSPIPPSLKNIFKEINIEFPDRNYNFTHGDLTKWINNGFFLLNSALTVKAGCSNSHQELWSWFTDKVINYIDDTRHNIVFLLLGNNAKAKKKFITDTKNYIITGTHPSPMSANNGFFNSNIFKKIEKNLNKHLDWNN